MAVGEMGLVKALAELYPVDEADEVDDESVLALLLLPVPVPVVDVARFCWCKNSLHLS